MPSGTWRFYELRHLEGRIPCARRRRRRRPVPGRVPDTGSGRAPYVELHAHSAYSFLDGASLPEELAARAAELGYDALALTDHDGVYGSLEFAHAAKHFGVRPITGAEVTLEGGRHVTLLCESQPGYANLCRILTDAHAGTRVAGQGARAAAGGDDDRRRSNGTRKGSSRSPAARGTGSPCVDANAAAAARARVPRRVLRRAAAPVRARRRAAGTHGSASWPSTLGVPTVATGDVHVHHVRRARLQDVLVAIKHRTSLDGCERERRGNHESVLLAPQAMLERLPAMRPPRTREVAERCAFDLTQELGYRYPDFSDGADPGGPAARS